MKRIHLILNSHIDPIWLWPWEAGLDTVLATCRSACDRLDANPDIYFTKNEAWVYRQVELVDPKLFSRIRKHVENGRWEIVGGWWIQPDCNQPSGWGIEKQIELGREYFEEKFGQFPRIAYNVDSFGHAATFPGLLRAAGQDRYVMMRPGEHEMTLPSSLFRWRGYVDGPEVITFRLPTAYANQDLYLDHFEGTVKSLPEGIEDTMAFVGVGDHGGGPTEAQIEWCRVHKHAIDGWEMIFSTPSRFFDAIADNADLLPVVTGELQMHAIGCYTVHRSIKTHLRRAEHLMAQAEIAASDPLALPDVKNGLKVAWQDVCFHQFHDTLGGTCIPSAYRTAEDQLGSASAFANRALTYTFRRKTTALGSAPEQRIALWNANDQPFSGYVEFEPWFEGKAMQQNIGLTDQSGRVIPHQHIECEAAVEGLQRILFHMSLEPGELRTVSIATGAVSEPINLVSADLDQISNDTGVTLAHNSMTFGNGAAIPRPNLHLINDDSDTWSHGLDRYSDDVIESVIWTDRRLIDSGPLMASWIETGRVGESSHVVAEWRVYAGQPFITLDLKIDFREKHRMIKLTTLLNGNPTSRVDGILGGSLVRNNDGRELPIRDWTLFDGFGVAAPDVYAGDATPDRFRLTLLRSPLMAHHEPHPGDTASRQTFADQTIHRFRLRFYGDDATEDILEKSVSELERPPLGANITKGMPTTK